MEALTGQPKSSTINKARAAVELITTLGTAVFPAWGVKKDGKCECPNAECDRIGKHPICYLAEHGLLSATKDEEIVENWFRRNPWANIGVVANDDWFALDIDPRHGGDQSLAKLQEQFGKLPPTVTQNTGGGGQHLIYLAPKDGRKVSNGVNVFGPEHPGIDLRGGGRGYIIAAPSKHASLRFYAWAEGLAPGQIQIAPAPEWVLERVIQKPKEQRRPSRPVPEHIIPQDRKRALGLLEAAAERVADTAEGGRNQTLFDEALNVGGWVGAGFLERSEAEEVLEDAGRACGLDKREAEQTVANGLDRGEATPKGLPEDSEEWLEGRKQWLIDQGLRAEPLDEDFQGVTPEELEALGVVAGSDDAGDVTPVKHLHLVPTPPTVTDVLAKLDEFAKTSPTPEQWARFWPEALYAAGLSKGSVDAVLEYLVKLKVGKKHGINADWKDYRDRRDLIAAKAAKAQARAKSGKTVVQVEVGEEQAVTKIEQLLVQKADPEFPLIRDSNGYVRPKIDRPEWGKSRKGAPVPTIAMFVQHDEASLRWVIARHLDLAYGDDSVHPGEWATHLLDNPLPKAPKVRGLITHPLVLEDGRLIERPGYDAESGLYLHLGGQLGQAPEFIAPPIEIPTDPAEAQALAKTYAQELLVDYADYRFEEDADKEVALSARFTILTRKDLDIAPAYLMVGPERGTGKTTLAAIDHVIATGHDIPAAALEDDSEKAKQTLFSIFAGSPAAVLFDNLPASECYGNDVLAQALTKSFIETRGYYTQRNVRAPTNVLLYFTGNAITLSEDIQTRTLEVRFSPERPAKWSHPDWLAYARSIRESVRTKIQYIQRAYIRYGIGTVAGCYTRFPKWAQRVRDPLLWSGLSDVGRRFQELEDNNPNRLIDAGIVGELASQYAGKFTAGEVALDIGAGGVTYYEKFNNLRGMIQERQPQALGKSGAQYLGKYFREHLRRWLKVGDKYLRLKDHPVNGRTQWHIEERME